MDVVFASVLCQPLVFLIIAFLIEKRPKNKNLNSCPIRAKDTCGDDLTHCNFGIGGALNHF